MSTQALTFSLHNASQAVSQNLQLIESRILGILKNAPASVKLDALQVVSRVHLEQQSLTGEILGKLGGGSGRGQKDN